MGHAGLFSGRLRDQLSRYLFLCCRRYRLLRLPLWNDLPPVSQDAVIEGLKDVWAGR